MGIEAGRAWAGELDEPTVRALYDEHWQAVWAVAYRVTGDRHAADDVAQEVFVRLWSRWSTFDPERGSVRTWLRMISHGIAVSWVRTEVAQREKASLLAVARRCELCAVLEHDEVDDRVTFEGRRLALRAAIDQLSPEQRVVVQLVHLRGLTHTQAAEALDIPLGTAKTRVRSGVRRLGDLVDIST